MIVNDNLINRYSPGNPRSPPLAVPLIWWQFASSQHATVS